MINQLLSGLPNEPLSTEREQLYARALTGMKKGEKSQIELHELLVLHAMREAFFYARKCCRGGLPVGEIYSLAYSALSRAVITFRPDNIRFFSYAKVFLRGEICREWRKKDVIKNVSKEQMILLQPTLNLPSDRLASVEFRQSPDNPDDLVTFRGKAGPAADLDKQSAEPEFDAIHAREIWETLEPMMDSKLSPKERRVIKLRYLRGLSFWEIGKLIQATRSGAQVIHARALTKLRGALQRSKKIL